jgi:hypothetical protein
MPETSPEISMAKAEEAKTAANPVHIRFRSSNFIESHFNKISLTLIDCSSAFAFVDKQTITNRVLQIALLNINK